MRPNLPELSPALSKQQRAHRARRAEAAARVLEARLCAVLGACFILSNLAACGSASMPTPDLATAAADLTPTSTADLAVERHPELLIGTWSFMLTQSATNCADGGSSMVMFSGTMHITAGSNLATVATDPDFCPVTWTVVDSTATLDAGQTCMGTGKDSGGPFTGMDTYFSGTIATTDGKTATYHDSMHETKQRDGEVYESCDIMRDGSLMRSGP